MSHGEKMEISVGTLIQIVTPTLGLLLYLTLLFRMKKLGISDPPNKALSLIFFTYGGWLMFLSDWFWNWSVILTIVLAYLMLLAPVVMVSIAYYLFTKRNDSAFHFGAFIASAVYIVIPIGILIHLYRKFG